MKGDLDTIEMMDGSGFYSIGMFRALSINYRTLTRDATIPGDHMRSYAPTGNYIVSIMVEDRIQIRYKEFLFDTAGLRRFNELLKESRVYKEFIEPYYKMRYKL